MSGGERQLALIARALVTEAKAIVLDEPTANLDFGNQARVLAEIGRLRDDGIAVLLCTHDPDHALEVADRALLLREGKVLAQGPTATVLTGENLSALYGLPGEGDAHRGRRAQGVCGRAPDLTQPGSTAPKAGWRFRLRLTYSHISIILEL